MPVVAFAGPTWRSESIGKKNYKKSDLKVDDSQPIADNTSVDNETLTRRKPGRKEN